MAVTRVSNYQLTLSFIDQINQTRIRLEESRNQVSSGLKVSKPSDDPGRAGLIAQFQSSLTRIDRHQQRIEYAVGMLSNQETAIEQASNLIVRAKEIATQAANETLSSKGRQQLAGEVWALRDQLESIANTKYANRYVFAGADDDDAPFDRATYTVPASTAEAAHYRVVFDGEAGATVTRTVEIGDVESVRVNSDGSQIFNDAFAAIERLGRALEGFRTTPENLSGLPDGGGVAFNFPAEFQEQSADIRETIDLLEGARLTVNQERTSIGSRMARVDQARELLTALRANLDATRSTYQDVDMFRAASELTATETSLQGLLSAGSRIQSLTLLDFL